MPADADGTKPARPHRKLTYAVIAVATLIGFLAACSIWINRQILNTDNWTKSSAAMLQNTEVRTQLSGYLTDQIYANVDVAAQLEQALPPRLAPLAAPAASGLENAAEKAVYALLGRPRVQDTWEAANRVAHTAFLDVIYDRG